MKSRVPLLALLLTAALCVPVRADEAPGSPNAALRHSWLRPEAAAQMLESQLQQGSSAQRALAAWSLGQVLVEQQAGSLRLPVLQAELLSDEDPLLRGAGELLSALRLQATDNREQAALRLETALAAFVTAGSSLREVALAELHCDALRLQARLLAPQPGKLPEALQQLRAAADVASSAGARWREALALLERARLLASNAQPAAARADHEAAVTLIETQRDPLAQAALRLQSSRVAQLTGDGDLAQQAAQEAWTQARRAQATPLQAQSLLQQAELYRTDGEAAAAAAAVGGALELARAEPPAHWQPAVRAAAGLTLVRLGKVAEGRTLVEEATWAAPSRLQRVAEHDAAGWLRRLDVALRDAGDVRGAVAVYHRERELRSSRTQRDLEAAAKELELTYKGEHQRREIELLNRENAHKAATREARELQQRTLWVAAMLLALALALATLLYRRQRVAHRALAASETRLRTQSERDPLTGLANRRHLVHSLQAQGMAAPSATAQAPRGFEGALLMLDVDRFKQTNDRHGHAVGDALLVEVAQRLQQTVRGSSDVVVRWGGEEFLVYAPALRPAQVSALAERLLRTMNAEPLQAGELTLPVGVSVGYVHFPLPPSALSPSWERAVNLADLALYEAKRRGRGRACGIVSLQVDGEAALAAVEADFDAACADGRVGLVEVSA